jgi:hypothetical protein
MSVEAWQAIKRLEKQFEELQRQLLANQQQQIESNFHALDALGKVEKLVQQYKMLNARMNKKNNGETDRQ